MPFVTMLRVQRGKITQHVVGPAPFPVEMPAVPIEPPPSVAKAKPVAPAAKPATATPSPSTGALVFSGKKTEPVLGTANSLVPTNAPAFRAVTGNLAAPTNASVFAALPLVQTNSPAVPPQPGNALATVQTPKQDLTPTAPKLTPAAPKELAATVAAQPKPLPEPAETPFTNAQKTNALAIAAAAQPPPSTKQLPAPAVEKPDAAATSEPVKITESSTVNPVQPAAGESLLSSLGSIWLRIRFVFAAVIGVFIACWFFVHQRRRARESARPISLITRSLDRQTH